MRCDQRRLTMKTIKTPTATNMVAAMESLMFLGTQMLAMRRMHVTIRDIEKPDQSVSVTREQRALSSIPNKTALNRNLWPLRLFSWKMVMCHAALIMKSDKKTMVIGRSTPFSMLPPRAHVVGTYGAFLFICMLLEKRFVESGSDLLVEMTC
jgi:hypothetical protein